MQEVQLQAKLKLHHFVMVALSCVVMKSNSDQKFSYLNLFLSSKFEYFFKSIVSWVNVADVLV